MAVGVGRGVDVRREAGYSKVTVPHIWPPPAALLQCRPHFGYRDEEYFRLKILTCMLPEL